MDALIVHDPTPGRFDRPVEGVSAVDLADVALATAMQRGSLVVLLEPVGDRYELHLESDEGLQTLMTLGGLLGPAVLARLALLASLDPLPVAAQMGRIAAQIAGVRADLAVLLEPQRRGVSLELRRLVGLSDVSGERATAPRELNPGERLGPYRLGACLGRGGHGTVFAALHEALAKPVAIKILNPDIAARPELATLLLREGRLAARARSPRIVNVTDFGASASGTYLVMELVEWPTLEAVIAQGPLRPESALGVARQILRGLEAAHAEGVIHRDLKPSNVFVGPDGDVKIGDFGTAKLMNATFGSDPHERVLRGSPHYASPEHCLGGATDARTDLYAVGCMLFEMLTGYVPFEAESLDQVMAMHVQAPVPPLAGPGRPLPEALDALVVKALAKRADRRFQTAVEMGNAMDGLAVTWYRAGRRTR